MKTSNFDELICEGAGNEGPKHGVGSHLRKALRDLVVCRHDDSRRDIQDRKRHDERKRVEEELGLDRELRVLIRGELPEHLFAGDDADKEVEYDHGREERERAEVQC